MEGGGPGGQPARTAASPPGRGGQYVGRRDLVAEGRPGPSARRLESAADAGADVLDEGVLHRGGDAGQVAEGPDGTRPMLGLCRANFATHLLHQEVVEVHLVRGQEGNAHASCV